MASQATNSGHILTPDSHRDDGQHEFIKSATFSCENVAYSSLANP